MRIRSRSMRVPLFIVSVAIGASAAPGPAAAAWPQLGRGISTAPKSQQHSNVATDGAGGAIITWQDLRAPRTNVFAQHVLATGEVDAGWPANGQTLLADSLAMATADGGQTSPVIVPDGAGGAIVAWLDLRSTVGEVDIFAQHVLASGVVDPAWPANGTALCAIEGVQNNLTLISDGAGGAIATWRDGRPGASLTDIYAQRVLTTGVVDPRWPVNGAAVSSAPGSQESPTIVGDGAGGAIITWQDARIATNFDVYAQHVLNSGVVDPAWPVNGLGVCLAAANQGSPTIATDGAHGAVVVWTDGRLDGTDHIFAQHVLGLGVVDPAWPADGRGISNAGDRETRPLVVSDGAGGAIVAWQAFSSALNKLSVYVQHVTGAGVVDPAWAPAGRALSTSVEQQTHADIVPDGAGGAIVAWEENFNIVAQHVLASGALDPAYPAAGLQVCNLPSAQGDPALVATCGGGAIVAWTDTRSGVDVDIYAMQVLEVDTVTAVAAPPAFAQITFARPRPNPARGPFTLKFALPREALVRVAIYDASGRRVRELASGALPAGERALTWDLRDQGGHAVGAGLYFARLEAGGLVLTRKLVTLR
jgi:hypothetical protein